jgi:hypothetical protein
MGDALPYAVSSDDAVRGGAWTVAADGTTRELAAWLPHWDISQSLRSSRLLDIDLDRLYEDTDIPNSSRLGLSVSFLSEFEDEAYSEILDRRTGRLSTEITVEILGELLGSTVTLATSVILRDEVPQTDQPVAWRRGSVLWSDLKKVRLYGDASQFPVTEIDFADFGLDAGAPWFLEIGAELELPAMGAIQLLLNSRFPLVVAAAREQAADRPDLAVVRSQLFADIGRTLIESALAREEIGTEAAWPDDSLGSVLSAALNRFPESVSDLRRIRDRDPPAWAAKLAASFGLLREPLP